MNISKKTLERSALEAKGLKVLVRNQKLSVYGGTIASFEKVHSRDYLVLACSALATVFIGLAMKQMYDDRYGKFFTSQLSIRMRLNRFTNMFMYKDDIIHPYSQQKANAYKKLGGALISGICMTGFSIERILKIRSSFTSC